MVIASNEMIAFLLPRLSKNFQELCVHFQMVHFIASARCFFVICKNNHWYDNLSELLSVCMYCVCVNHLVQQCVCVLCVRAKQLVQQLSRGAGTNTAHKLARNTAIQAV